MKFNKNLLLTGTLASALILGACGSNASANDNEDSGNDNSAENTEQEASSNEESSVLTALGDDKVQEAIDIANENFDGLVEEVSYESDDGKTYYEVNMESETEEYEIELDSEDLSVINEETEEENNNEKSYNKLSDAHNEEIISLEEAEENALQEVEGEVTGWQYDVDDFKYEFEINSNDNNHDDDEDDDDEDDDEDDDGDVEVEIDAKNGEVVEIDS